MMVTELKGRRTKEEMKKREMKVHTITRGNADLGRERSGSEMEMTTRKGRRSLLVSG